MMPKEQNLYCYRGQTWEQSLIIKQDGEPIDLTDAIIKAQVRPNINNKKLTAEIECTVTEEGKISMNLTAEQTAKIVPGVYQYDLQVTKEENVQYYIYGKFFVSGRVTE